MRRWVSTTARTTTRRRATSARTRWGGSRCALLATDDGSRVGGLRSPDTRRSASPPAAGSGTGSPACLVPRKQLTLAGEYAGRRTARCSAAPATPDPATIDGQVLSFFGVFHIPDPRRRCIGRVDVTDPNTDVADNRQTRFIAGVSYQLTPALRLLADVDNIGFEGDAHARHSTPPRPRRLFQAQLPSNPTARTESTSMRSTIFRGGIALGTAAMIAAGPRPPRRACTGAGATFPNPIYTKWFDAYNKKTGVQINYQSIGSGGGIRQFTEGTVDFGATDGPMNDEQIAGGQGQRAARPDRARRRGADLQSSRRRRDAAQVRRARHRRHLPGQDHQVERQGDRRRSIPASSCPTRTSSSCTAPTGRAPATSSPTTSRKVSPDWKDKVGKATRSTGRSASAARATRASPQQVKQTQGAIGYVELIYALPNKLAVRRVKNAAGEFVDAVARSRSPRRRRARSSSKNTDFRVSITNAPGKGAYPISSFTWLLVRPDMPDAAKAKAMRDFLGWMITPDAQKMADRAQVRPASAGSRETRRSAAADAQGQRKGDRDTVGRLRGNGRRGSRAGAAGRRR